MKRFDRIYRIAARLFAVAALPITLGGCSAALHSYASSDDGMYGSHNKIEIANRQRQAAELRKAEAEARRAELEARIAEAQVRALEDDYYDYPAESYSSVVADTYESAYLRRLRGFNSPTYRMPSSYYNLRYSGAFNYATAYDPAFYNIMVSGDQVWVEPKYISSMFGSWGATNVTFGLSVYPYSWYYGWHSPYYGSWWGFPHYSWYDWNWGMCYGPYHWGLGGWAPSWSHGWNYGWGRPSIGPRPPFVNAPRPTRTNLVNRPAYTSPSSGNSYGGRQPSRGTVNGSGTFRSNTAPAAPSNGRNGSYNNNSGNTRGRGTTGSGSYNNSNRGGSSGFFNNGGNSGSSSRSQSSGSSYNNGGNRSQSSGSSGSYSGGGSRGTSGGSTGRGNSIGR